MAATLATVRNALYTRLTTAVTGVTTATVYRYELGRVEYPAVIIGFPDRYVPDTYGGATRTFDIPVRCEAMASADWASGNVTLEALIDVVIAAVEYDTSLGSTVDDCAVADVTGFGFRTVNENLSVLVAEVNVVVYA